MITLARWGRPPGGLSARLPLDPLVGGRPGSPSPCHPNPRLSRHVRTRPRLQRDSISAQDGFSDAGRVAAEGARNPEALGEARPLCPAARIGPWPAETRAP